MQVIVEGGRPIKAWVDGVELEDDARRQLVNVASLPFIYRHVAVMPDVHWGMGATVGSVIPTQGAILPAAVGVDLGCGMIAQRTTLTANDLPDSLAALRSEIEAAIPVGGPGVKGSWQESRFGGTPAEIGEAFGGSLPTLMGIIARHPGINGKQPAHKVAYDQLGTLGTGNHFIEVCLDERGDVWIMLHSGSRGVGNRIASYFIDRAKAEMARWFVNLPDADLAYLPEGSDLFDDYVAAVSWAQDYALENRHQMLNRVIAVMARVLDHPEVVSLERAVSCHHNYVSRESHYGQNVWVTRKGAVRAREGDLGIIPGSMGVRSYIVLGKGNPESFHSCSHGAGRRMSRGQAKRTITLDDHIKATEGVECRKDAEVIDESPAAYKDIDAVIAAQSDLIAVVHTLKQVLCVKG